MFIIKKGGESVKNGKAKTAGMLFLLFLRIGAFTFGGGYAMIPLIERDTVEKKHLLTEQELLDVIAIAESTPGPIAVNAATFIGYRCAGIFGAFCATLGVVLPSFLIISLLSLVLNAVSGNRWVQYAFRGVRAGVLALLVRALISMYKKCPKGAFSYIVMGAAFLLAAVVTQFVKFNVIFVLLGCAIAGLIYSFLAQRRVKT